MIQTPARNRGFVAPYLTQLAHKSQSGKGWGNVPVTAWVI